MTPVLQNKRTSLLVGELAQVPHNLETRASPGGYLHRAFDMLTSPVAAARAVVATGALVKSKHMYLIRGSVGAYALFFYPSAGG